MAHYPPPVVAAFIALVGSLLGVTLNEMFRRWKTDQDRRAAEANTRKADNDADEAAAHALSNAFATINHSLAIINDLRGQLASVESDLKAARATIEALSDEKDRLTQALAKTEAERDEARTMLDLLRGENRQLKQVAASATRAASGEGK